MGGFPQFDLNLPAAFSIDRAGDPAPEMQDADTKRWGRLRIMCGHQASKLFLAGPVIYAQVSGEAGMVLPGCQALPHLIRYLLQPRLLLGGAFYWLQ